jgi:hypothetical protein
VNVFGGRVLRYLPSSFQDGRVTPHTTRVICLKMAGHMMKKKKKEATFFILFFSNFHLNKHFLFFLTRVGE